MKRGKPPRRKTRLRRGKPPKRSALPPRSFRSRARRREVSDAQWAKLKRWVRSRDEWKCAARIGDADCTGEPDHVHHLLPTARGGADLEGNLLTVCDRCHAAIHANPEWAYEQGLLRKGRQ